MVGRYGVRAGVLKATKDGDRPINPHMLRHSYATRLINAGVPVHAVQRALGHSHLATTSVYLHVSDDELADQLREALSQTTEEDTLRRLTREELQALRA